MMVQQRQAQAPEKRQDKSQHRGYAASAPPPPPGVQTSPIISERTEWKLAPFAVGLGAWYFTGKSLGYGALAAGATYFIQTHLPGQY